MPFSELSLSSSSSEQIVIAGKGKSPVKSIKVDVDWGCFWYLIKQLQVCQIVIKTQENKINRTKKRKRAEIGLLLNSLVTIFPLDWTLNKFRISCLVWLIRWSKNGYLVIYASHFGLFTFYWVRINQEKINSNGKSVWSFLDIDK